ncbi:hypothetical protein P691DRAFT_443001 [Macrolepiota fuliginosa MF-IS2]|uniref:Transfer RNA methyltransferase 82 n=1 Tax=Macrolepiota fuliginosa MF-IS2 TaxID=1400762 RepID=A0A9P6C9Q9_9AGAR|nr:hypothetical protein P691DRAFT_443001 [Macrolepiota fuliginosa MF-IS2]
MPVVPYTRIFIGPSRSVAISGSQIYILNSTTGEVVASTSTIAKEIVQKQEEETQVQGKKEKGKTTNAKAGAGPIVAAAVNGEWTYLLTVKEDKMMKLWEIPELKLINERELPKRPTSLAFTKDSQTILVSDKFGDVFSYPFTHVPPQTKPSRDELSSHENPSDGHLVLGHASPLNAFTLSYDEKYIITADRDEHIRVSWYPQGYNIEMYCLGHRKYVSAIHLPPFAPDALVSGGGDPTLKFWNWMSGKCVGEVRIWEEIEPFIGVKSNKRRRGGGDGEEDEEGGEVQKRKGKGKKSKRKGKKGKGGKEVHGGEGEGESESKPEAEAEGGEQGVEVVEEKVLVVSKIGSAQRGDAKFVIFSAVGATALFGFQYPAGPIEHFDFGYPVVDLATDDEGKTWVSLDTAWSAETVSPKDPRLVRVVQFNEDGKVS